MIPISNNNGCCCLGLDDGIGRLILDAALAVFGHPTLNSNKARFTPISTPRVLDLTGDSKQSKQLKAKQARAVRIMHMLKLQTTQRLPVVHAILGAIAHHQHTVIQLLATLLGQDSPSVELESHLVSLSGFRQNPEPYSRSQKVGTWL